MPRPVPHVLHVATECTPLAKAGGLGDVVGALPRRLRETERVRCSTVLPRYAHLADVPGEAVLSGHCFLGWQRLDWSVERMAADTPTYLVRAASFDEPGLYSGERDFERQ